MITNRSMTMKNSLKILTIGNSFADSLITYFPQVVASVPGCTLLLDRANHGGCELHRHWSYICNEESDDVYRMYQDCRFKMREILAREKWDIISIQQASHFSWQYQTYQPFASNLCDYIKQRAPQAEIVIQQTWAYRADDPRIRPGGVWDYTRYESARKFGVEFPASVTISQKEMYEKLTAAYRNLAKELQLRLIPTGYAVQLCRKSEIRPFQNYAPELMKTLRWPDMPQQAGDVVGRIFWKKNPTTGELELDQDSIHLNRRGEYLQACVWFAFLYGRHVREITFVPDEISDSDAEFLRQMAQQSVDEFK